MNSIALRKQYDYYVAHEKELLEKFEGKHLVISDNLDVAAFNSGKEACRYGVQMFGDGHFLLQQCESGNLDIVHNVNFTLAHA